MNSGTCFKCFITHGRVLVVVVVAATIVAHVQSLSATMDGGGW